MHWPLASSSGTRGTGPPSELKLSAAIAPLLPEAARPPSTPSPEAGLSLSQVWKELPGRLLIRTVQLSAQDRGPVAWGLCWAGGGQQGARREGSVERRLAHFGGGRGRVPPSSPAHAGWAGALSPWMPDPRALLPAASLEQPGGGHTPVPSRRPALSPQGSPQPVRCQDPAHERLGQDRPARPASGSCL